jgi:hypothetical protein
MMNLYVNNEDIENLKLTYFKDFEIKDKICRDEEQKNIMNIVQNKIRLLMRNIINKQNKIC